MTFCVGNFCKCLYLLIDLMCKKYHNLLIPSAMRKVYTLCLVTLSLVFSAAAQLIPSLKSGSTSIYTMSYQNVSMEINADLGGRISSFKVSNSKDVFSPGPVEILNQGGAGTDFGSTFWPSPQAPWSWPPIPTLDNLPYTVRIEGNAIVLTSGLEPTYNLRFVKRIQFNTVDTSIVIKYIMINESTSAQSWAPWEVTRVAASGLTIFKKGDGSITGPLYTNLPGRVTQEGGYVWYNQGVSGLTTSGGEKLMSDGVGWLAHIPSTKNRILIKRFENIPLSSAAQGESEVQIYTGQNNSYTELENQGAYVSIPAGDSTTWTVRWYGKGLPFSSSAANVSTGSTKVSNYIEQVVARGDNVYLGINNQVATSADLLVNAAQEYMTVKTNLTSYNNVELLVYDLQGKIALKHSLIDPQQQVSIKGIAAGSYLYQINTGTSSIAKGKFLINP